jgi:hypothetical protein
MLDSKLVKGGQVKSAENNSWTGFLIQSRWNGVKIK